MQARRKTPGDIKEASPAALARARVLNTTDADYLARVATDPNALLRMCVVDNPHAPLPVVLQLAGDSDADVRAYVARQRLTETHQAPLRLIETLAADDDPRIRLALARYFYTPRHVLMRLAADDDVEVRHTVANRRNVPDEVVAVLCEDRDRHVRGAARYTARQRARNPRDRRHRSGAHPQAANRE